MRITIIHAKSVFSESWVIIMATLERKLNSQAQADKPSLSTYENGFYYDCTTCFISQCHMHQQCEKRGKKGRRGKRGKREELEKAGKTNVFADFRCLGIPKSPQTLGFASFFKLLS